MDVAAEPALSPLLSFSVKIQFSCFERWHERRADFARAIIKKLNSDPDDIDDVGTTVDAGEAIMEMLYPKQYRDAVFLQQLTHVTSRNSDPNPKVNAALTAGTRIQKYNSLETVRAALRQLVARPSRDELDAGGEWLFPVVERVWVRGHFPSAIVPSGVHIIDVPGVDNISLYRVQAARAAVETSDAVFLVASCADTAERPFSSRMVQDELSRLARAGARAVLVLTGSDAIFDEPDGEKRRQRNLADALQANINVPIVHCAASKLFKPQSTTHPTAYGVRELVAPVMHERTRVLAHTLNVSRQFEEAVLACETDLMSDSTTGAVTASVGAK